MPSRQGESPRALKPDPLQLPNSCHGKRLSQYPVWRVAPRRFVDPSVWPSGAESGDGSTGERSIAACRTSVRPPLRPWENRFGALRDDIVEEEQQNNEKEQTQEKLDRKGGGALPAEQRSHESEEGMTAVRSRQQDTNPLALRGCRRSAAQFSATIDCEKESAKVPRSKSPTLDTGKVPRSKSPTEQISGESKSWQRRLGTCCEDEKCEE